MLAQSVVLKSVWGTFVHFFYALSFPVWENSQDALLDGTRLQNSSAMSSYLSTPFPGRIICLNSSDELKHPRYWDVTHDCLWSVEACQTVSCMILAFNVALWYSWAKLFSDQELNRSVASFRCLPGYIERIFVLLPPAQIGGMKQWWNWCWLPQIQIWHVASPA